MKNSNDLHHNKKLGEEGEQQAVEYLCAKGYRLLHRNWHYGHKELDIVCMKDNTIIVVEVKSRMGDYWEEPKEAVKRRKQKNIIEAADAYVNQYNYDLNVQFDVVSIVFYLDQTFRLEHIPDAFFPIL